MVMLVVAASAVGLAVAIGLYALASHVPEPAIPKPERHRTESKPSKMGLGVQEIPPLYERFAGLARRLTPADYTQRVQRRLDVAGNPKTWPVERVVAFKGIGLVAGLLLGLLYGVKLGGAWLVLVPPAMSLVGFFVPDIWIRNLGQRRQIELRGNLPDAIDMMTVCVEAGLGFDAALARVAQNMEGPTAEEFARILQEMQFGKSRVDALRAAAGRTDVSELRTFISSIVQSTELGISMGDVLRAQAGQMRVVRRQRAEEKAQKLPVKLLMPLILCILPTLFMVVLGPAVLNLMQIFSGFGL